jgi:hypothetical protein
LGEGVKLFVLSNHTNRVSSQGEKYVYFRIHSLRFFFSLPEEKRKLKERRKKEVERKKKKGS